MNSPDPDSPIESSNMINASSSSSLSQVATATMPAQSNVHHGENRMSSYAMTNTISTGCPMAQIVSPSKVSGEYVICKPKEKTTMYI